MKVPDVFYCPVSLEIMKDPVICEDGYSYDRESIVKLTNDLSPITRQKITRRRLVPNRALKNIIEMYMSKYNPKNIVKPKKKILKHKIIIPKFELPKPKMDEIQNNNIQSNNIQINNTNFNIDIYILTLIFLVFLTNVLLKILVPIMVSYLVN
jgi:hypothetical protein